MLFFSFSLRLIWRRRTTGVRKRENLKRNMKSNEITFNIASALSEFCITCISAVEDPKHSRNYHSVLIKSAAFSATPYSVLDRCALICSGITDASTTRTFAVSYTRRCPSTTPPRSRRIIAAVPIG